MPRDIRCASLVVKKKNAAITTPVESSETSRHVLMKPCGRVCIMLVSAPIHSRIEGNHGNGNSSSDSYETRFRAKYNPQVQVEHRSRQGAGFDRVDHALIQANTLGAGKGPADSREIPFCCHCALIRPIR